MGTIIRKEMNGISWYYQKTVSSLITTRITSTSEFNVRLDQHQIIYKVSLTGAYENVVTTVDIHSKILIQINRVKPPFP